MTLMELYEQVQEAVEEVGEDKATEVPVRLAHQPSWPLEYGVDRTGLTPTQTAFYIAEGAQRGYLSHEGAVAVGWASDEEEG
jgi:hypothetical protein